MHLICIQSFLGGVWMAPEQRRVGGSFSQSGDFAVILISQFLVAFLKLGDK